MSCRRGSTRLSARRARIINFFSPLRLWCAQCADAHLDADDVLVVEVAQNLDLAQRALRVGQVLEGLVDLLDRHLFAGLVVECRANHAVRTMPNGLDERVAAVDVEAGAGDHEAVDLPRAVGRRRRRRLGF